MDAAFGLAAPAPAAGANILAGVGAAGARHAAPRAIAGRRQWMSRQGGRAEYVGNLRLRHARQRSEFQPAAVVLNDGQAESFRAVIALAPVDPGVERRECAGERLDLAQRAAGIGMVEPEIAPRVPLGER